MSLGAVAAAANRKAAYIEESSLVQRQVVMRTGVYVYMAYNGNLYWDTYLNSKYYRFAFKSGRLANPKYSRWAPEFDEL